MSSNRLALYSQRMAVITLVFIVVMMAVNAAAWLFPEVALKYGLSFALTERQLSGLVDGAVGLSGWQRLGGILLSSIPLLALAAGLVNLRQLFRHYAQGMYFSSEAAVYLGNTGRAVALWVLLDFLCEPFLSLLVTINAPVGQRLITLSVTAPSFVALFLAACIAIIARILSQASEVDSENRTFV
ncbi:MULTISPECIES: DUF2975 domain-containing protein [Pseudomonas]|jgi:hypothetical protein|uniref:DUF2975 domain-containing protein n=1 Tax=Pseudomonas TaxID=286 RepID=UPI000876FF38|nr:MULTISPECIES: DUF2975 domain-containing protein [Pseudomonas]MDB6444689.1 DUF2975 domain-containing protein [Pseudomonas sp. 21TX0197]MDT8905359.1 DUF2975 domain-containing protein [Pseudomonas prosekii]NHN66558.1 DUF2975 domain-containing protein [Pseudomonas fluorescens]ROO39817.1 DUF2975 domain-containing protein [Pseudomonas sp. 7SR1]ROO42460.1 DUF2975 domain-containing protein [Pseudomonas sp. AF76]